jgi:hypothetical protein
LFIRAKFTYAFRPLSCPAYIHAENLAAAGAQSGSNQLGVVVGELWSKLQEDFLNQQAAPNVKISIDSSPLAAWVIRTDEGMQLANECVLLMN